MSTEFVESVVICSIWYQNVSIFPLHSIFKCFVKIGFCPYREGTVPNLENNEKFSNSRKLLLPLCYLIIFQYSSALNVSIVVIAARASVFWVPVLRVLVPVIDYAMLLMIMW